MNTAPNSPSCPRCGYDLSGITATFADHCPTRGTCSECGHEFSWTDVFSPHLLDLPGFIEHARTLRAQVVATFTTFLWLLWPRRFWARITLDHQISIIRPIIAACALHIALQLLSGCVSYAVVALRDALDPTNLSPPLPMHNFFLWPIGTFPDNGTGFNSRITPLLPTYAALLVFAIMWPLILLMLPATRRLARLRPLHIARAGVYAGLVVLAPTMALCINNIFSSLDRFCRDLFRPTTLGIPSGNLVIVSFETLLTLSFLWVALWWYQAINSGWRMQRGGRLWLSLLIASAIVSVFTFASIAPHSLDRFLLRFGFPV